MLIYKEGRVLLGKRRGSHGAEEYSFPGGNLEHQESFADCARREVKEECGLEIDNLRFQLLANIQQYDPKHYVHITIIADWKSGEPEPLEPDKCEAWNWYSVDELPKPLFFPSALSFDSLKTGRNYYDNDLVKELYERNKNSQLT